MMDLLKATLSHEFDNDDVKYLIQVYEQTIRHLLTENIYLKERLRQSARHEFMVWEMETEFFRKYYTDFEKAFEFLFKCYRSDYESSTCILHCLDLLYRLKRMTV